MHLQPINTAEPNFKANYLRSVKIINGKINPQKNVVDIIKSFNLLLIYVVDYLTVKIIFYDYLL